MPRPLIGRIGPVTLTPWWRRFVKLVVRLRQSKLTCAIRARQCGSSIVLKLRSEP